MTIQQTTITHLLPQDGDINFERLFGALFHSKWLIIAITLLSTLLGATYVLLAPPEYKSIALLQVEEKSSGMASFIEVGDALLPTSNSAAEIEIITSRKVLGAAIRDVNRDIIVTPNYFPLLGKFIARRYQGEQPLQFRGFSEYAWGGETLQVSQFEVPERLLNVPFTLRVTDDGFILLNAQGKELATSQPNTLVEQNGLSLLITELIAPPNTEFTLRRISQLTAVSALKHALTINEKSKSGILELSLIGQDPIEIADTLDAVVHHYLLQNLQRQSIEAENSLQFLAEQQPELKAQLDKAEERLNKYRQLNKSVDLGLETQSVLTQLVTLEKQINELSLTESELSRLYTSVHPSYQALLEKKRSLMHEKAELSEKVELLPNTQQEVLRLTRDVEVSQDIYIQLLNKVQELNIVKAGAVGNVRIIDGALTEYYPVKPKKQLIIGMAVLLGAMLGAGWVLVRYLLNRGVESPKEFEQAGLNVFACVPFSHSQNSDLLLAEAHPEDLAIESLKSLRSSLHFTLQEANNHIVAIGGPGLEVGKTFISANLAVVFAQSGKKVLLIDADLRKGYLHTFFNLAASSGLSNVLNHTLSLPQAIHTTQINNLSVIPRGQAVGNSSELLMQSDFQQLLAEVSPQYDLVIIDTPPILAITDPVLISAHAATTLLVSRFAKNSLDEVKVAVQHYRQSGITVSGIIFNAVAKQSAAYNNYGYYHYEYHSEK